MNSKIQLIKKIPKHYVGDDCVQEMIGYGDYLLFLGPNEVLYKDFRNGKIVNKYLEDERRMQFPYGNIPVHNKNILFRNKKIVNQLVNFNTPYLHLSKEMDYIHYAVKDNDEAYIVYDPLVYENESVEILTRYELDSYFMTDNDNVSFIYRDDVCSKLILPTDEQILNMYIRDVKDIISEQNEMDRKLLEGLVKDIDMSNIPRNYKFVSNKPIIQIIGNDSDMKLYSLDVKFINYDCYQLCKKEIIVNNYNLEQINSMIDDAYFFNAREPKINRFLNRDISPEEIKKAKCLIKKSTYR